jgi:hypothetical protein
VQNIKKIMNLIGTPFNAPKQIEVDHFGCIDPYNIAKKNKIELLSVEPLSKYHSLPKELADELNKQRQMHEVLQVIAIYIHAVEYKYAIIKHNSSISPQRPAEGNLVAV